MYLVRFVFVCTLYIIQAKSDFIQRSILSPIVPEAAIFYLENYGPEKYAEVFLGEFDNPEIIWNSEMR